jgi:hypothetical protein
MDHRFHRTQRERHDHQRDRRGARLCPGWAQRTGGYSGGGTGVNLVGAGASLNNAGSITGGGAGVGTGFSPQDRTPGVGVRAWGGATVTKNEAIAGGSNNNGQADLFSGGGN